MAADSSNLGFIMVNERTGEYKYFAVSSANEQSAMNAAEGEVQQYGYQASFPTLINVDNELAYIGVFIGPVEEPQETEKIPVEFIISVMQYIDVDGNTYVYMGTSDSTVYKVLFSANEQLLFAKV